LPAQPRQELLFERPDAALYTSLATLPQKAGVAAERLARLVCKELADNALDAADAAGKPGAVEIRIANGNLIVADQGPGIVNATPEQLTRIFSVGRPMLSSKLLRRPCRGAVGNGLRVCLGYITATGGRLRVETGSLRVDLDPEADGTSRIASVATIKPSIGVRPTVIAGDAPFVDDDLAWAEDAIELAKQSGKPAFTGRPSVHWIDLDHFRVLLKATPAGTSVRSFLAMFDGCTGSKALAAIAAPFLRRLAAGLDAREAAQLLAAAQAATRTPKAKALCPLGRDAVVTAGYAIATGDFLEGRRAPYAKVQFAVEAWADAFHPSERNFDSLAPFMNRTVALAPASGHVGYGRLLFALSNASTYATVPAGPHYAIVVNITSPMFRLLSDGKAPDCQPFQDALAEAIGKAAKQAGHDIATMMSAVDKRHHAERKAEQREQAEEQRLSDRAAREARRERLATEKAERIAARKARPTQRDAVLELLPGAVAEAEAAGYLFNTRHIVYAIREQVRQRTGEELKQAYFDALVTELEAERGDLSPLLIREARGNYSIPHHPDDAIPLGTIAVREFERPDWTFNKIVTIEKEDLRLMLRLAGWDRRHDAFLTSAKGFNTRASKDIVDKIVDTDEPVRVFSVHDGDAAGTLIQHTLQHATKARGARKTEVTNIGLEPWEGFALGLGVERVSRALKKDGKPKRRAVGDYVKAREDRAPTGETWEEWLQHSRFELNAFSSARLIEWLGAKMVEHGAGKLIPPDAVLVARFGEQVRGRAQDAVALAIVKRRDDTIAAIESERSAATAPLRAEIARISAPLFADRNPGQEKEPRKRLMHAAVLLSGEHKRCSCGRSSNRRLFTTAQRVGLHLDRAR
jgi:DNA topoisomerase VI subunit B